MMVEYPIFLWLAVVIVPLMLGGMLWRERQAKLLIKRLGLVEKLINLDTQRRRLSYFLRLGVIVCLLVAMARPKWGVAEQIIVAEGAGVVWVLDASRSMDVQDILPSRLERAKLTINILMGNNPNHQFGMVVFAGDGFIQFPMTFDHSSAQALVQSVNSGIFSYQGTNLTDAIQMGLDLLDERMIDSGIVVVLSDGENNRAQSDFDQVMNEAIRRGVPIFGVGYGTLEGGMIPEETGATSFVRDGNDELVISRLDETLLSQIATRTGGAYQIASSTGDEVAFLQRAIDGMTKETLERRSRLDYVARFPVFVALALVLLMIDGMIGYEKKHPIFDGVSHHGL